MSSTLKTTLIINQEKTKLRIEEPDQDTLVVGVGGETHSLEQKQLPSVYDLARDQINENDYTDESDSPEITAPIPGVIGEILVKPGEQVSPDTPLITLIAMKMENEICAPKEGIVANIAVLPGATVQAGDLLLCLEDKS